MRIEGYKESDEKDLLYVWEESAKIAHGFIDEELLKTDILRVWNEYSKKLKTYVAKEGDILCGFLSMYGNNIAGIFVAPMWQRKHIGTSLIEMQKKIVCRLALKCSTKTRMQSASTKKWDLENFRNICIQTLMRFFGS